MRMKTENYSLFTNRLSKLEQRIKKTCSEMNINRSSIMTLAVSKKMTVNNIKIAISHGLKDFGESYLNEAVEKINELNLEGINGDIEWHYIGSIQKNKTKKIAENFDWVHSVDRFEIAKRLSEQRPCNLNPLKVFIQVNIDDEKSKSGVPVEEVKNLAISIGGLPKLSLFGLMAIPKFASELKYQKKSFLKLQALRMEINKSKVIETKLKSLSMGMSGDLEAAICATETDTKTWLRIGTSLFGERNSS